MTMLNEPLPPVLGFEILMNGVLLLENAKKALTSS
jgi:hypothetical protein